MPAAAPSPEEQIQALAKGEAEVRCFIAQQQRKQAQARAEIQWRHGRRKELRANLVELCGFRHPVVSLQRVVAINDEAGVHEAMLRSLNKAIVESETEVRKAERMLPDIEARRARALLQSRRGVLLEFRRPEGHR
jgi:hypothetical protein